MRVSSDAIGRLGKLGADGTARALIVGIPMEASRSDAHNEERGPLAVRPLQAPRSSETQRILLWQYSACKMIIAIVIDVSIWL